MKIISPNDEYQYFFGYYDLQPLDFSQRYHLANRVKFFDRLPNPDDVCEIGLIDMNDNTFHKISETTAWNFQQGCMLRFFGDDSHIAYNVRVGDHVETEIKNIKSGETRHLNMPFADISADGKMALSVNFSRIYDFRPGYGYAGIPDKFHDVSAPENDGVYLMDTQTGKSRLIIDYDRIRREFPQKPYCDDKLLVNHITFNPSGTRFLFLLRNFPKPGGKWKTMLISSDLEGNMYKLTDYCVNSHYHWKNDSEILIVSSVKTEVEDYCMYLFYDLTDKVVRLPEPNLTEDIHCIYSHDRKYIIGDAYPDEKEFRALWLIDCERRKIQKAVDVYSVAPENIDVRCDLHARWSRDDSFVTFDSTHTGKRTICRVDMSECPVYRK